MGTGRIKVALADRDGGLRRLITHPTPVHTSPAGAWLDADELVAAVFDAIRACATGETVAAIGVASMAEAGVPLDREDRPLTEMLAWTDARAAEDADAIRSTVGASELFARTGLRAEAKYTLPRLHWLRSHRPAQLRRMRRWAGVADLVGLRLTGSLATDASLAGRTLAFDLASSAWDAQLLALAGIDAAQMPPVLAAGTSVGSVNATAAGRARIQAGVPVAVAGHDHLVGAFGAGVTESGHAANSMGTAEVALVLTREPMTTDQVLSAGLTAGLAAGTEFGYVLGNLPGSGRLDPWFESVFGMRLEEAAAHARQVPSEVTARPFVTGAGAPFREPGAAASLAGLRADHEVGDVGRALLEGASYQVRLILERIQGVTGHELGGVTVFGGSSRNPQWISTKANILPWSLAVSATPEAVVLGAARIAARAVGDSVRAAAAEPMPRDPTLASAYADAYRRYLALADLDAWPRVNLAR